jgi:hypothetical protein
MQRDDENPLERRNQAGVLGTIISPAPRPVYRIEYLYEFHALQPVCRMLVYRIEYLYEFCSKYVG